MAVVHLLRRAASLALVVVVAAGSGSRIGHSRLAEATAAASPSDHAARSLSPGHVRTHAHVPTDPLWGRGWGLRATQTPAVWRSGTGSQRTVVAVLDTGVDEHQPDLAGALTPGWNVLTNSASAGDDNGHGTEVAGVIAARSSNGIGVTSYCWRCTIMPVKVLDSSGRGSGADIAGGIRWATGHGASVINLSFVLSGPDADVSAAIADATARGVVVVAAAGNDGRTDAGYPAADPGVVSVGAMERGGRLYRWSASGSWVTTAGPGCNESTATGGRFVHFCGTSSAAAAVSGLLALVISQVPGVTVATLKQALRAATSAGDPRLIDGAAMLRTARASVAH